jgi:hypothetical protein
MNETFIVNAIDVCIGDTIIGLGGVVSKFTLPYSILVYLDTYDYGNCIFEYPRNIRLSIEPTI